MVPLPYHDAVKYDTIKYTKFAFGALKTRKHFLISTVWAETKRQIPSYIDHDEYVDHIVEGLKQHPELSYDIDPVSGRPGFIKVTPNSKASNGPALSSSSAAAPQSTRKASAPSSSSSVHNSNMKTASSSHSSQNNNSNDKTIANSKNAPAWNGPSVEETADRFITMALKTIEAGQRFAIAYLARQLQGTRLDGISLDEYVNLVVARMQKDARLLYIVDDVGRAFFSSPSANAPKQHPKAAPPSSTSSSSDSSSHATSTISSSTTTTTSSPRNSIMSLSVEDAAEKFTQQILNYQHPSHGASSSSSSSSSSSLTLAQLRSDANRVRPTNWPDESSYFRSIVAKMEQDPRLEKVHHPKNQAAFVKKATSTSSVHNVIHQNNIKTPISLEAAVERFTTAALKALEKIPLFAHSYIRGEAKSVVPPEWGADAYVQSILERMRMDRRLDYDEDDQGRGQFTLARPLSVDEAVAKFRRHVAFRPLDVNVLRMDMRKTLPPHCHIDAYMTQILDALHVELHMRPLPDIVSTITNKAMSVLQVRSVYLDHT